MRGNKAVLWVFFTLLLQLISALLLQQASEFDKLIQFSCILLVGCAFAVNIFRFVLWGYIHKNYELSHAYPIVALFYPLIFLVSIFLGYASFEFQKILGALLIVVGVILLNDNKKKV